MIFLRVFSIFITNKYVTERDIKGNGNQKKTISKGYWL